MAIHWFFFVVPQSWARTCVSSPRAPSWPGRVKKWAHPVFPLQTRHPTLPLPGRPQRSLAKLWNAIKDVEWVGAAPPKTRSAWTGAVAKEMYLQTRCQDYFTAMSCFYFSHTTTICITEKKIFFHHIKIFLSNLLLYSKEQAQLCFFQKLVGFGELES